MAGTKKTDAEVGKVEETTKTPNLFGASEGENFLAKTLGQNFSQVKKTLIEYKTEDIKREMKREIQDRIIVLRRDARKPQDDLTKIIPTSPMQTLNLSDIDEKKFCEGIFGWGIECHNAAQKILSAIKIYQNMFNEDWDSDEKEFVKALVIDFRSI
jgi:hypothetical protein